MLPRIEVVAQPVQAIPVACLVGLGGVLRPPFRVVQIAGHPAIDVLSLHGVLFHRVDASQ